MYLKSLLLIATGASAAFTVPADQPNGVYSVSTDSSGASSHTLLRSIDSANSKPMLSASSAEVLPKADDDSPDSIGCGDYTLFDRDVNAAAQGIYDRCGTGFNVEAHKDIYALYGGTVSYFCNYSDGTNQCDAGEAQDAFSRVNATCGMNTAGWDINADVRKDSYGYEARSVVFCGIGIQT